MEENFRDSIATISEEGKRAWIHPKKPSGKYHFWFYLVCCSETYAILRIHMLTPNKSDSPDGFRFPSHNIDKTTMTA